MMNKTLTLYNVPDIFFQIHGDFFGEYDLETPFIQGPYLYAVDRVVFVQKYIGRHPVKANKRRLPDMEHMCMHLQSMSLGEILVIPPIPENSKRYYCPCKISPKKSSKSHAACEYCKGTGVSHTPIMMRQKNSVRLPAYHIDLLHRNRIHFAQVIGDGGALRFQGDGYTGYILTMTATEKGPVPAE